jgi:galactokinase
MSAESLFQAAFGGTPTALESAPGRVNLIGEHTDYNGGFAMPIAISQSTDVATRANGRAKSRAASEQIDIGAVKMFNGELKGSFVSYVQGARWALEQAGQPVPPVDVAVSSTVPVGSGLSSSAALLVATLRSLRGTFALDLSDTEIARLAYRAEREFVGVPVGTLDQMACSLGSVDAALFLDTLTLEYEKIALPPDIELVVVDSGVRHHHASGGYRTRREECERAARALDVRWLCDLKTPMEELTSSKAWQLLAGVLRRRARHVLSENQRVIEAAAAMRANDVVTLGRLFDASHASLRDDFEVSTPEVDALVAELRAVDDCIGARMTGGGFGGAVVALAWLGTGERVAQNAVARFSARFPQLQPKVISPFSREDLE